MTAPEFSRPLDARQADRRLLVLDADPAERAALARRFGLIRIERLRAELTLDRVGEAITANGTFSTAIVQSCAVSAEDLAVAIDEPLTMRFVPARRDHPPDEEVEIDAADCDEIEYDGVTLDLGEAVAQSLALAIDPFATGPAADAVREAVGLAAPEDSGPFAALGRLRDRR